MALDFPSSPTGDESWIDPNGVGWTFNGQLWHKTLVAIQGPKGDPGDPGIPGETDHSALSNLDLIDQHPIAVVTGLTSALAGKSDTSHTHALDALSDVSAPTPTTDDHLKFNGSAWIPESPVPPGGIVNSIIAGTDIEVLNGTTANPTINSTVVPGGQVEEVRAGSGISVDSTDDPTRPIISTADSTAVQSVTAGTNIVLTGTAQDPIISANFPTINNIFLYDNVAAMVADTGLQIGDFANTRGYYAIGDSGNNQYEIVALGTGTDDGGSYINLATTQAKAMFNGVPNFNQFGAKGDRVTDDIEAFRAAVAYSNDLVAVPGNGYYLADKLIVQNKFNVNYTFTGATCRRGFDSTSYIGSGIDLIQFSECYGIIVTDFSYDANGLYGRGIGIHECTDVHLIRLFTDNQFSNFCFAFNNSQRIQVTDCNITSIGLDSNCDGLHFFGCSDVVISGGYISTDDDCISFTAEGLFEIESSNITVTGVVLRPKRRAGVKLSVESIALAGMSNVTIDCTIIGNNNTRCIIISNEHATHVLDNINITSVVDATLSDVSFESIRFVNIANLTMDISLMCGNSAMRPLIIFDVKGLFGSIKIRGSTYNSSLVSLRNGTNIDFMISTNSCPNGHVLYTGADGIVANGRLVLIAEDTSQILNVSNLTDMYIEQHAYGNVPIKSIESNGCDRNIFNNSNMSAVTENDGNGNMRITGANSIIGSSNIGMVKEV